MSVSGAGAASNRGGGAHVIDVVIDSEAWRALPEAEAFAAKAAAAALRRALGAEAPACSATVLLADDARLRALNEAFRGRDAATNVLAWPSRSWPGPADIGALAARAPDGFLGDVALAIETVEAEARAFERALAHHAAHLIVHGTLHLIGYDHRDEESTDVMESMEDAALASLGLPGGDA